MIHTQLHHYSEVAPWKRTVFTWKSSESKPSSHTILIVTKSASKYLVLKRKMLSHKEFIICPALCQTDELSKYCSLLYRLLLPKLIADLQHTSNSWFLFVDLITAVDELSKSRLVFEVCCFFLFCFFSRRPCSWADIWLTHPVVHVVHWRQSESSYDKPTLPSTECVWKVGS